jgi:hypothetical protein
VGGSGWRAPWAWGMGGGRGYHKTMDNSYEYTYMYISIIETDPVWSNGVGLDMLLINSHNKK